MLTISQPSRSFQLAETNVRGAISNGELAPLRGPRKTQALRYESPRYRLVGSSEAMGRVVGLIARLMTTDATVLVSGSTGTGKELVARALHANSPRRDRPLVTVNCATLQPTLLESELFGHERGAFTGADKAKTGLFEAAEGGTLFLDEIGELPVSLQAKLLRVLEDGHYRRVGSTVERRADVRVIAATNRRLEDEVEDGRFRADLFYRIGGFTIPLPSLRDHRADIPELVEHFLATRQPGVVRYNVRLDALEAMVRYDWPGNVRELANGLEWAQLLAEGETITAADLPEALTQGSALSPHPCWIGGPGELKMVVRVHVRDVLTQTGGNKVQAAKVLGVSRRTLYRLIAKFGLSSGFAALLPTAAQTQRQ